MPYIDATGVKLYFEESGMGYPIIFVHELGSDLEHRFQRQLRGHIAGDVARRRRLFVFRQHLQIFRHVAEFFDDLCIAKVPRCGISRPAECHGSNMSRLARQSLGGTTLARRPALSCRAGGYVHSRALERDQRAMSPQQLALQCDGRSHPE
jgi:hypothetical protein